MVKTIAGTVKATMISGSFMFIPRQNPLLADQDALFTQAYQRVPERAKHITVFDCTSIPAIKHVMAG